MMVFGPHLWLMKSLLGLMLLLLVDIIFGEMMMLLV
jgi:hypothetical protein